MAQRQSPNESGWVRHRGSRKPHTKLGKLDHPLSDRAFHDWKNERSAIVCIRRVFFLLVAYVSFAKGEYLVRQTQSAFWLPVYKRATKCRTVLNIINSTFNPFTSMPVVNAPATILVTGMLSHFASACSVPISLNICRCKRVHWPTCRRDTLKIWIFCPWSCAISRQRCLHQEAIRGVR